LQDSRQTTGAEKSGSKKYGSEYRSRPETLITRCSVEVNTPFVHLSIMSPIFTTKLPAIGGASIQRFAALRTCSPPTSSCASIVRQP